MFLKALLENTRQNPRKAALVYEGKSLCYAELLTRCWAVAEKLRKEGVAQGQIVPIVLPRGLDAMVCIVGVLLSGGAFCFVDTAYPKSRIAHILADTGAKIVIDAQWIPESATEQTSVEPVFAGDSSPAMVVYTSGSTGNPKGVVIPHKTLSMALDMIPRYRTGEDVFLSTAPFSFVAVVCDALSALYLGATLHIASDTVRKDVLLLDAYTRQHRITTAFIQPQMLAEYLKIADGILRVAVTGSEKVQNVYSPKTLVLNLYGSSETCGPLFCFAIDKPYAVTPIAGDVYNSGYVLLDENDRAVPAGETGEICVWGQIGEGYLNQPALTQQKFIQNPVATGEQDARIFRTGDLGRVNQQGQLTYVQRKDWMMKVNGCRVEPGEIESAILSQTAATSVVVKAFENIQGQSILYGVYTAPDPLPPADVKQALQKKLPAYMIPSFLTQIAQMPRNVNGKVDRGQITPPDKTALRAAYEPPRNETEQCLCKAFADVLDVSEVGIDDDFTLLGGDSITAVKVQLACGGRFSAEDIVSAATVRRIAALENSVIPKSAPCDEYPLTSPEEQMAIEQYLHTESVAYNVNIGFRLTGDVSLMGLQNALDALVERHEALRSFYNPKESGFIRQVMPEAKLPIVCERVSIDKVSLRVQELNVPFDLSKAPLLRCHLFDTGDGYVLHFCLHHIIFDRASGGVFAEELWQLYNGEEIPALETTLGDYALWKHTHGEDKEGEDFFDKLFTDGVPENEMPLRGKRPELLPEADTLLCADLPLEDIDKAAKRIGVSKYALLISALGAALGKYCGSEDVVLGAAMSGRNMTQQDRIIGMFVNTVPLRIKPAAAMQTEDYIRTTAQMIRHAKTHQAYPFEKLAADYAPDRTSARSPIYDVSVNYISELPLPQLENIKVQNFPLKSQAMRIDMSVEFRLSQHHLTATLAYSPHLFHHEVMDGFMEQLQSILHNMLAAAPMSLRSACALPMDQQNQLLEDFQGKIVPVKDKTVLDGFMRQAKETPSATAVLFKDETISYEDLDSRTTAMAAYMHEHYGIGAGDTVGVIISRSHWIPLCSISIMKTGAAYVPLDPAYPSERLLFMLSDSRAKLLIASDGLESRCAEYSGAICKVEELADAKHRDWTVLPPKAEDLMVLLYTSGTTGNPKGVMLSHAGVANFCQFFARKMQLKLGEIFGAYASYGFDAHMNDMYPALISGAAMFILEEELRLDLTGLMDTYHKRGVTAAFLTTQMGRQLVEAMVENSAFLQKLHTLVVGGETLVPIETPPNLTLINGYGPTECSMASNTFVVNRLYEQIPIGVPVDNTRVYILDKNGDLAPVGVAGELCIAGVQVSKGYLNRPDLTAEKFVQDPFAKAGDIPRMYKSGDVARYLPDGNVDFLGRRDFQVKIRGFRVELTEVERRIRAYPPVKNATVQAMDAPAGGKRIVAYVVMDTPLNITELNDFIAEKLPVYMVPSATMQIPEIPLTQNGKVNRRGLPEITIAAEELVPAATELQSQLLEVFHDILGVEIGINTDVMYAGLSSLSAIRAAAKISARTGKHVLARTLLEEKTVERIASFCEASAEDTAAPAAADVRKEYPLSSNQMGVYYACQKNPSDISYNIPFCVSLNVQTDADKLAECVKQVVDAHPYIKTQILLQKGEPVQLRRDTFSWQVPVHRLDNAAFEQKKACFVRPFTLLGDTLARTEIFVTTEGVYLLCDFHHIVFDGASADVFLRELGAAWDGVSPTQEAYSTFDLALEEQNSQSSHTYKASHAFFEHLLEDGEGATILPAAKSSGEIGEACATVPRAAMDQFLKSSGITRANLFLAATALVISRVAGTAQPRMATIINGRDGVERQNLFGMLVKTLPAVIDVCSTLTAQAYCDAVQQRMFGLMEHSSYPYAQIAADFHYDAQILYAYQGGVIEPHTLDNQPLNAVPLMPDALKFPISIRIYEENTAYRIQIGFDRGMFDYMPEVAQSIAAVAEKLAAQRNTALGTLNILSKKQTETLCAFNRPIKADLPFALHQLFEAQARTNPHTTALVATDKTYTYDQLNSRANRLAHTLLQNGVQKGDRIAFMLPRTSDVLVCMLGILKAGGCYIPVDPDYPAERVSYIIQQSGAKILLTTTENLGQYQNALDLSQLSEDTENPCLDIRADDLCYIIYTSGSTGKPKGVVIRHGGIVNYVTNVSENRHVCALTQNKCIMCSVTTVSFDMFLKEAFTTLMNGLTLVLASEEEANNPKLLTELMQRTGATAFNATPSRMLQYMELPEMREALSRMKVILAGGEKYPPVLQERLRAMTDAMLINTYGPTEITVSSNGKVLDGGDVTVGMPLYNVVESIMDKTGNPLPVGITGELYIGGTGVAVGYFNNPELTQKQFLVIDGVRYYKSGDLAKWTSNGEIAIAGRNDGQIKLRGLRIELGEIEKAITENTEVKNCTVQVRTLRGQEHLCAYYTADKPLSPESLKAAIAKKLTQYMVPTAYLQMDAFPITPNGKLNQKALPEAQLLQSNDYEAPANACEEDFCRMMGEILGMDKVSAAASFFEMGGHSLLVTRLTIEASRLGYDVSFGDVFANPTPRELAALHLRENVKEAESHTYDYSEINGLLSKNTLDAFLDGSQRPLGNLLLTGATGFLGIHILRAYLGCESGTVYCLVRGKNAEKRLMNMLNYYFSDTFEALFGSRIVAVHGDLTDADGFAALAGLPIDTVIHCAANVKHFSAGTDIHDINVGGTANVVNFAQSKGCRLVYISTVSVGGMTVPPSTAVLDEATLYFGQDLSNQYVSSKLLAERLVLEACLKGLDGKIIRVGNLMARDSDGEFQINFNTNNFLRRLKSYANLGKMPYTQAAASTELAPIDCTADAILRLSCTPAECVLFHAYNNHSLFYVDIVEQMNALGMRIELCEDGDFGQVFKAAAADLNRADILRPLIAYRSSGSVQDLVPVSAENHYTTQILLRLGFHWPISSQSYIKSFLSMVQSLGGFDF